MLGTVAGRGVVLSYDMVFVPDPAVTPFALGAGVVAPRAVPSDLLVALLGQLVPGGVVQAAVLLGALVGAGTGSARLVRHLLGGAGGLGAELVAVAVTVWNPYVAERLVIGQWTVLLAVGVLPWAVLGAVRCREGGSVLVPCGWLVLAACGGATTALLVSVPVLVLLAMPTGGAGARRRQLAAALLVAACANASWWLPALAGAARTSTAEPTTAFVARADGPWGLVPTLLVGGGIWNPSVVPPGRGALVVTLAALALVAAAALAGAPVLLRGDRRTGAALLVPGAVALVLVAVQGSSWVGDGVADALAAVPGGGLLRDGQKLIAWWVLAVAWCAGSATSRLTAALGMPRAVPLVLLAALAPLAVLPGLAGGAGGRLTAVQLPSDYAEVGAVLDRAPAGAVGSAPWGQYRRYAWNGSRVSLDVAPRALDRRVVLDDSLPLSTGRVPGEDPVAARVSASLASGGTLPDALRAEGVRYLLVEQATAGDLVAGAPVGSVLFEGTELALLDLGEPGAAAPTADPSTVAVLGYALSAGCVVVVLGLIVATRRGLVDRRRRTGQ